MASQNLNDPFIKNYQAPTKRVEVYDDLVNGLALRVTTTGHKSFVFRYRFNKKVKRFTIGSYPNVSLSKARSEAKQLSYKVMNGIDPLIERQAIKKEPEDLITFSILCDRFTRRHLPTLRKTTAKEYLRVIDVELKPLFGDRPANEIQRKEIIDLLDEIAFDRGSVTSSNRVRATISSIFSFGIDKAIVEANPVLSIKRKKGENKRDRVYSPEELKVLWNAFENQAEPIQSIYKMLLLCGQRSGETRRLKWNDIDSEKKIWTIPKEQTKAKRTHIVPLSETAFEVLENIRPLTGKSEFVFQSPKLENQPVEWLQKATDRIKKESGVEDFRVHDLRRSMASYMAQLGIDRTVLGKTLNHKGLAGDDQVTAIYDRYDYMNEKRIALENWGIHLKGIINGAETKANVYKIGG